MRIDALPLFVLITAALGAAACQRLTDDEIAHGKLALGAPGDVLSTGTISAINDAGTAVFPRWTPSTSPASSRATACR